MTKIREKITNKNFKEMNQKRWLEETRDEMEILIIMTRILNIDPSEIMRKLRNSKSDEERIWIVKKIIQDKKKN